MASPRTSTTSPRPWALAEDGSNSLFRPAENAAGMLSAPDAYNHSPTLWQTRIKEESGSSEVQRVVLAIPADTAQVVAMKFIGSPLSQPGGQGGDFYIGRGALWGVSRLADPNPLEASEYLGEYLGRFDLTVGADGVVSSGILPAADGVGLVRRATVIQDRACMPGVRTVGRGGDAAPVLVVGVLGYTHLIVELRCVRADNTVGAIYPASSTVVVDVENPTGLGFLYRFA